ncbi:MAG TPA: hypothetical protein VIH59_35585 [Candidatus Tectomicrobia bacterium]
MLIGGGEAHDLPGLLHRTGAQIDDGQQHRCHRLQHGLNVVLEAEGCPRERVISRITGPITIYD